VISVPIVTVVDKFFTIPNKRGIIIIQGEVFGNEWQQYVLQYDYVNKKVLTYKLMDYNTYAVLIPVFNDFLAFVSLSSDATPKTSYITYTFDAIPTDSLSIFKEVSGKIQYGMFALSPRSTILLGASFLVNSYHSGGVAELRVTSSSPTSHAISVLGTFILPKGTPDAIGTAPQLSVADITPFFFTCGYVWDGSNITTVVYRFSYH